MSFVPVTGLATFRPADPPRDSVVEFSDERRTVALPMRAALPVLTRVRGRDDVHPSVGLLSGAVLLGMRLVADGKFEPGEGAWRIAPLDVRDAERVALLASSRGATVDLVRQVLDAIADTMPRSAPVTPAPRRTPPAPV
ncbi:MAG: SNF2-related protein, partial [Nocardioides sp.]|nr:SNF2-related protein [Nocardioides sp.]